MGSLSNYAEDKILDHILGTTAWSASPTAVYLALWIGDPTDTGSGGAEVSAGEYNRKAITFAAPATRAIAQNAIVTFDQATTGWGTVDYWAIFDAASGGNMLAHGQLSASKNIVSGNTPSIASGQITITFNTGKISTYLAHAILNHIFRDTEYTQPSIYAALVETTEIVDGDDGTTIDELDMTGYAREAVALWDASSGGASSNTNIIDFSTLTSTGETVTAACLTDNATKGNGNVLFYDNTPNQAIGDGDTVQFAAGAFDVSID